MADIFCKQKRSEIMSAVKGKNTSPEVLVRSLAHKLGFRFRLHSEGLPGKPDIVFPCHRKAVFVNGCFWHGHNCKRGRRLPQTNVSYWRDKIAANKARDRRVRDRLHRLGLRTLTIWECQLRDESLIVKRLRS